MEKCVAYRLSADLMREKGESIVGLVEKWLHKNNLDVDVYDFTIDNNASLIIDYNNYEDNNIYDVIKKLTEQLLNSLNIQYILEV